jgi:Prealbumin-like fold domain
MHVLRRIAPFSVVALALMLALALGALAMFGSNRADAHDATPHQTVQGNQNCANFFPPTSGIQELRVEPVADGTYSNGTLTVTIDVRNTGAGQVFDITSANIGISAVAVKGGNDTNRYLFDPPKTAPPLIKDLHAPVGSNGRFSGLSHISFCYFPAGEVKITKTDDAGAALAGAEFTLYKNNTPLDVPRGAEDTITNFKCTTAADGTCTISGVTPGNYWVVETLVPPGHSGAEDQAITVTSGQTTQVGPLVNPRDRGAIQITKTRKHAADGPGDHAHAGVDFVISGGSLNAPATVTTDVDGKACLDGLLPGNYNVHENTPAGYNGEADKTVTVDNKASCSDATYGGETVSFSNTPLTDLDVSVTSQVTGGTKSTIDCDDPNNSSSGPFAENPTLAIDDLEPGTYTCTVVIDP